MTMGCFALMTQGTAQQTLPGLGSRNTKPLPPVSRGEPQIRGSSGVQANAEALERLAELLREAQTLEREIRDGAGSTVSAAAIRRCERVESLAKAVRKSLRGK